MTENNNRVCCLYRVSTDKQVDFTSNHEADLPMQRKACHKFAESKGWVIVHEEQEEGVSGHKVRAAARDKLQIIKDYARRGKFDILLVFMFDRIGRIADETPFVVEWFVRNGIPDQHLVQLRPYSVHRGGVIRPPAKQSGIEQVFSKTTKQQELGVAVHAPAKSDF